MDDELRQRMINHVRPFEEKPEGEPSGFLENLNVRSKLVIQEDMAVSSFLQGIGEMRDKRKNQVNQAIADGLIPSDTANYYQKPGQPYNDNTDYNGMAYLLQNKLGMTDVLTDKDIRDVVKRNMIDRKAEYEEVMSRADFWGKTGQALGAFTVALDPILLPTYALGGVGAYARGVKLAMSLGRIVGTEVGIEAVRQKAVYDWKQQNGIDYSIEQAVKSIALTGLVVGGVSVAPAATKALMNKAVTHRIRRAIRAAEKSNDPQAEQLVADLRQAERELHGAYDPEASAVETFRKIEKAVDDLNGSNINSGGKLTPEERIAFPDEKLDDFVKKNPEIEVSDEGLQLQAEAKRFDTEIDDATRALEECL